MTFALTRTFAGILLAFTGIALALEIIASAPETVLHEEAATDGENPTAQRPLKPKRPDEVSVFSAPKAWTLGEDLPMPTTTKREPTTATIRVLFAPSTKQGDPDVERIIKRAQELHSLAGRASIAVDRQDEVHASLGPHPSSQARAVVDFHVVLSMRPSKFSEEKHRLEKGIAQHFGIRNAGFRMSLVNQPEGKSTASTRDISTAIRSMQAKHSKTTITTLRMLFDAPPSQIEPLARKMSYVAGHPCIAVERSDEIEQHNVHWSSKSAGTSERRNHEKTRVDYHIVVAMAPAEYSSGRAKIHDELCQYFGIKARQLQLKMISEKTKSDQDDGTDKLHALASDVEAEYLEVDEVDDDTFEDDGRPLPASLTPPTEGTMHGTVPSKIDFTRVQLIVTGVNAKVVGAQMKLLTRLAGYSVSMEPHRVDSGVVKNRPFANTHLTIAMPARLYPKKKQELQNAAAAYFGLQPKHVSVHLARHEAPFEDPPSDILRAFAQEDAVGPHDETDIETTKIRTILQVLLSGLGVREVADRLSFLPLLAGHRTRVHKAPRRSSPNPESHLKTSDGPTVDVHLELEMAPAQLELDRESIVHGLMNHFEVGAHDVQVQLADRDDESGNSAKQSCVVRLLFAPRNEARALTKAVSLQTLGGYTATAHESEKKPHKKSAVIDLHVTVAMPPEAFPEEKGRLRRAAARYFDVPASAMRVSRVKDVQEVLQALLESQAGSIDAMNPREEPSKFKKILRANPKELLLLGFWSAALLVLVCGCLVLHQNINLQIHPKTVQSTYNEILSSQHPKDTEAAHAQVVRVTYTMA